MSNQSQRVNIRVKHLFLSTLLMVFCSSDLFGQFCNNGVTTELISITTIEQQTTSYSNGRRVFTFAAIEGNTYTFSTCNTTTGDTKLRLYATSTGGTELSVSDNDCGANGKQSEIIWLCPSSSTYSILLTKKDCKNLNFSASIAYSMSVPDPCSGITLNVEAGSNFSLCNGSASEINASASITYDPPSYSHCASSGNLDFVTAVTNFTFNGETTINNSTGKTQAYTDYSSTIIGEAIAGTTYSNGLSMKINSAGNWTILGIIWIDWNRNDIFENTEGYEMGSTTNSTNGLTTLSPMAITVPANTTPGYVKVRVACKWDNYSTQCETNFDGEAEDYAILVTTPLIYSWSPATEISNGNILNPNCSATGNRSYALTVSTANGCDLSDNVSVSVENPPVITTSTNVTGSETCGKISIGVATDAQSGAGSWSHTNGLGLFEFPTDATTTFTTNTFDIEQTLTWTQSNGICAGSTAIIAAKFNQPNTVNIDNLAASTSWLWGGLTDAVFNESTNWYKWDGAKWLVESSSLPSDQDAIFVQSNNESGLCVSETSFLSIDTDIESLNLTDGLATTQITGDISITGHISNNGLLNAVTGTISFNGSNDQSINGTGTTSLYNVVLNKTSGNLILNSPITIINDLNLTSGNILNGSDILTIGISSSSTGSITYNSGSVIGKLRRYFGNGSGSVLFPVGNANNTRDISVNIQGSPGTNQYLTIQYVNGYAQDASGNLVNGLPLTTSTGQYIDNVDDEGYWEISPTDDDYTSTINSKNYDIAIHAKNITGVADLNQVRMLKSPGSNTPSENHTIWMAPNHISSTGSVDDFIVTASGSGFSFFTIGGSGSNALPVELSYFGANCIDHQTNITWETESEYNSSHFIVEESRNGQEWDLIASVQAMGISTSPVVYSIDHEALSSEITYYRLSQYDIDGAYEIFEDKIIALTCSNISDQEINIYPNPNTGDFNVIIRAKDSGDYFAKLDIINTNGSIVHRLDLDIHSGINVYSIREGLSSGIYFIRVVSDTQNEQRIKFVVR